MYLFHRKLSDGVGGEITVSAATPPSGNYPYVVVTFHSDTARDPITIISTYDNDILQLIWMLVEAREELRKATDKWQEVADTDKYPF